jgi:WD40 repeat protein
VTDFTFQEARPLAAGLGLPRGQALQVLAWVLNWTGGHPYLAQRLCQEIAQHHRNHWSEAEVYRVVKEVFLNQTSGQDTNLQFVRDMLTRRPVEPSVRREIVNLYRAIRSNLYPGPDEEGSLAISYLKLSGVVRRENDALRVRNRIYAMVFDPNWIEEVEAVDQVGDRREVRRLRELAEARRKEVIEAEQRAESERLRAVEQAQAAAKLRRRALWLAGALGAVLIAVVGAAFAIYQAIVFNQIALSSQAVADAASTAALENQATANAASTAALENQAAANAASIAANAASTAAIDSKATAEAEAALAIQSQQTAAANRATADAASTRALEGEANAGESQATALAASTAALVSQATADAASTRSLENEATAAAEANNAVQAQQTAQANRATADAQATRSVQAEQTAIANQATANAEATRSVQAQQTADASRQTAEAQRNLTSLALSRRLATEARNFVSTDNGMALLLSLEANHITSTLEARNSLIAALRAIPRLVILDHNDSGHRDNVLSLAFSPDGNILASGTAGGKIILWNMVDRLDPQRLAALEGHKFEVVSLAFSPDGKILASGSDDKTFILWDVVNRTYFFKFDKSPHDGSVRSVTFSSDGELLASGSDDDTIRLWDVREPRAPDPIATITGHRSDVRSVAFNPGATPILASGGFDNRVILWNVTNSKSPLQISDRGVITASDKVLSVAFSPDGLTLASGGIKKDSKDPIILWNMSALAITTTIPSTETIWSVAFSQDGNTLALGITHKKPNETIILWNVKDWHKGVQPTPINPRALADHTESVRALAFSPDGKTLASGGDDDNIILWEINRENLEPLPEEPDQEDFDSWVKKACNIVGRNMTEAEIEQFKLEDILNEDNVTGPCPGSFPAPAMNLTSSSAPPLTDIAPPIPTLT